MESWLIVSDAATKMNDKLAATAQTYPAYSATIAIIVTILAALLARTSTKGNKLKLPPGPTALPILGCWLRFKEGLNPRNLAETAKKYGDVCLLRMGQLNVVVVSSPEMAREVLNTQGAEFGSRSRNVVFDMTTGQGQDMVFADYGDHWRKMRRIATLPFFTNKVLQQSQTTWQEEIDLAMTDILSSESATTGGIYIRHRLELMVYNIVYRMMFDKRFEGGLEDPLYTELMRLNYENRVLGQSYKYSYGDYITSFRPFLRGYLKSVWEANQNRLLFLRDNFVNERKNKLGGHEKIGVDHFLDAQTNGEINEANVLYLLQNMNVAAIETSLWSSEWVVAELINNHGIQHKLIEELDSVLGKGVALTMRDIPKLPYLQAVVKETLRRHLVVPMLVPHANLETTKLGGYDIPKDSRILVNAWGIANNPDIWENPQEFKPERFMPGSKENIDPNGNDFRFIPFGSGRRSCPGSILAQPLLALIIGRMVQSFELLAPPGIDKVDVAEKGGQLSMIIASNTLVVVKPRC